MWRCGAFITPIHTVADQEGRPVIPSLADTM